MTITLCGKCGKQVCGCPAEAIARPVERSIYADGQWHNGIRITRNIPVTDHMPLVKSPVILPDILETSVYGQQEKSAAFKKLEDRAEKRRKK
jgi:hypothetical protein